MEVYIFLAFFCFAKTVHANNESNCTTPNGEKAICIPLKQCAVFFDVLMEGVHPPVPVEDFMRKSSCGYNDEILICCGSFNHFRELSSPNSDPRKHKNFHLLPPNCGLQEVDERTPSEDAEAQLDEFPWAGLLIYNHSGQAVAYCGATLINSQYAVTAAHCVTGEKGIPFAIRFGDHDLRTEIDCRKKYDGNQIYEVCNESYQLIDIKQIISHRLDSWQNRHDIALIRLARPVRITSNVIPVCLPLDQEKYPTGKRMFVAGWGGTSFDEYLYPVKRKASLPIISKVQCEKVYSKQNVSISDKHICAGGEAGVNTCRGDGGNALVAPKADSVPTKWYMEGIVSVGVPCGLADIPSIFTRVSAYIIWILDRMD